MQWKFSVSWVLILIAVMLSFTPSVGASRQNPIQQDNSNNNGNANSNDQSTQTVPGEDLTMTWTSTAFFLTNTSGEPVSFDNFTFAGPDSTVRSSLWWQAAPSVSLNTVPDGRCAAFRTRGGSRAPNPPDVCDNVIAWWVSGDIGFWSNDSFEVKRDNVTLATCIADDKKCTIDLPDIGQPVVENQQPVNNQQSGQPAPAQSAQAAPAVPAKPAQPAKPAESGQPVQPPPAQSAQAAPANPSQPAQPAKPAESGQPVQPPPAQSAQAAPAVPAQPAQPAKPAEAAQPAQASSVQAVQAVPAQPAVPAVSAESIQCSKFPQPSRLLVGQNGVKSDVTGSQTIHEQADGDAPVAGRLRTDATFTVIENAQCVGGVPWVKIQTSDGTEGWTREANASNYLLNPA